MRNNKIIQEVLILGIFIFMFITFFPIVEVRSLDYEDITFNISAIFPLQHDAVKKGSQTENVSIQVDLPSESWNIKDMELNFTQINFEPEVKIIENNTLHGTYKRVYNKNPSPEQHIFAQAVQLNIEDPSLIYGVYIYGYNYLSHPGSPFIQLQGFDTINKQPNGTVFRSVALNMSDSADWYLQKFDVPILLNPGNYSVVLNGMGIPTYTETNAGFYWAYNEIDPLDNNLYTSEFIDDWSTSVIGEPFLYKIIQKLNTTIYPEAINMTAELDTQSFPVSNGNGHGKGYLKRDEINYHANKQNVEIRIKNNKTQHLRFNIDYNFNIYNIYNVTGISTIKYNDSIEWKVFPEITRYSNNDTVRFNYPKNWDNIQVTKNSVNITSEVIIDSLQNRIIIPNNTIQSDAEWIISGFSPNLPFNLNAPILEFTTGQELSFSLGTNPFSGKYTFKLYDPLGFLEFQTEKNIPQDDTIFSYNIPASAIEGEYTAFIFWNNGTDAGVESITFSIIYAGIIPQEFDFSLLILIGLISIGSVATMSTGYVVTKKVKSNKRDKLNLILEKCNDIMNLKYIIVLDPKTGIDLFSQSFEKKQLDPTLIAGFLQAIHNFGDEVLEGVKESKTIKVEYKDSIIVMTDFINVRLITILKSNPSKNFLYSLESLAYHIYKYYGKLIDNFKGTLKPFRSISKLVESDLEVSFRYPMTIKINKSMKLSQPEKQIVKRALDLMKENRFSYFYAVYLLPENNCNPSDYDIILKLIKKGVFQPIRKDYE
ncbi:MAG: hypothetical protein EU531_03950 [Promethearchaeota archaeon]|nr:MAG: hypothetical protein EU531_03950 [Candidatus Lokiarchaeota archaeon]